METEANGKEDKKTQALLLGKVEPTLSQHWESISGLSQEEKENASGLSQEEKEAA